MSEELLMPVPFEEAKEWIRTKPAVTRETFDKLLPELRGRAFTISGIENINVLQNVRDKIAELPAGAAWDEVKEGVLADILPWFVDAQAEPEERDAQLAAAMRRAELLLRNHGFQAYESAKWEVMERQKEVFPYWQYHSMEDERVRPEHAALDGLVLRADDPFWETHYPPWDWGCRCLVTALLPEEADAIEAGDEDGFTLGPEATEKLRAGQLDRGDGHPVDVTAPSESGKENAFRWNPRDLRLPVEDLKRRYDAETWKTFERWARGQMLDPQGNTVWDWMNGRPVQQGGVGGPAPTPPAPRPPKPTPKPIPPEPKPTPAPEPPKAPATSRMVKPISDALDVRISSAAVRAKVQHAIATIGRVHGDGDLPGIPIRAHRGGALGVYRHSWNGQPTDIEISGRAFATRQHLTMAHEIGHFLDHQTLGDRGVFASEKNPELATWRKAVQQSDSMKSLQAPMTPMSEGMRQYYTSERELWARSYAQWIAERSGDASMLADVDAIRKGPLAITQWSTRDFGPIGAAIDAIMQKKGWIQ